MNFKKNKTNEWHQQQAKECKRGYMSLMDVAEKYEKMLKNPENRGSSAGTMKQSTPYTEAGIPDPNASMDEGVSADEQAYMAEMDRRIKLKNQGISTSGEDGDRLDKIQKDLTEVKNLLVEMMKIKIAESKK